MKTSNDNSSESGVVNFNTVLFIDADKDLPSQNSLQHKYYFLTMIIDP